MGFNTGSAAIAHPLPVAGPAPAPALTPTKRVNYIWWGNPSTEAHKQSAKDTPNVVAAALTDLDIPVKYTRNAGPFDVALHERIENRPIAKASELLESDPAFMGTGIVIDNIIQKLVEYRAFSAVKDLVSLLVLYSEGVITSTPPPRLSIPTPSRTSSMHEEDELGIAASRLGGSLNVLIDDVSGMKARGDIATMATGQPIPGMVAIPNVDVWAMYAPAKHPAVPTMIQSHVERAMSFGLHADPDSVPFAPNPAVTVHTVMTDPNRREARNDLI